MKILPKENVIYKTKLKEEDIFEKLKNSIEPQKYYRGGIFNTSESKPYEGQIIEKTFEIRRVIRYRNSFLPIINGTISKDGEGSLITVTLQLHGIAIVFLSIWYCFIAIFIVSLLIGSIINTSFNFSFLFPVPMAIFSYSLSHGAFNVESTKSKIDFKMLFEAEMIEG
jgi:hypothetical protein